MMPHDPASKGIAFIAFVGFIEFIEFIGLMKQGHGEDCIPVTRGNSTNPINTKNTKNRKTIF